MKWQAIEIAFCFRGASGTQEGIMQSNYGKRSGAYWARGFAALWAALAAAAGGSALAAPVETVLYSFAGGHSDGRRPEAGLIADSSGNLYGTTEFGGASNVGVVFKLSPGGTETVLYSFMGGSDGSFPGTSGLIADSKGNLYGTTTSGGGTSNAGTVFELTFGTGFVPPVPFAAFTARQLVIQFGTTPNTDLFQLHANFTLGTLSNGINPPAEPVTLQVGTFTTTIPPFSFTGAGSFSFVGVINGVNLEISITPTGTKRYALLVSATNASLTGTVSPVTVTLTIGADTGTTSVMAFIATGLAVAN
jgi:uncharacterized repeat protein (TIGR03803 family)